MNRAVSKAMSNMKECMYVCVRERERDIQTLKSQSKQNFSSYKCPHFARFMKKKEAFQQYMNNGKLC